MTPIMIVAVQPGDLDDDDARPLGVGLRRQPELEPQVDDRNHLAAQVDHALDVRRHLRHRGDVHQLDDLAHLEHRQAVLLAAEREGQVLAGRSPFSCRGDRSCRPSSSCSIARAPVCVNPGCVPCYAARTEDRFSRPIDAAARRGSARRGRRRGSRRRPRRRTLAKVSPSDLITTSCLPTSSSTTSADLAAVVFDDHDGGVGDVRLRAGDAEDVGQPQQRHQLVAHLDHARGAVHVVDLRRRRPQRLAHREGRQHEALLGRPPGSGRRGWPASAAA